jgi:hypothetical protein
MTAPPVTQFRSRAGIVRLGAPGETAMALRVQMPEVWDVIRLEVVPSTPMAALKQRALEELMHDFSDPAEWVIKLRGFEILDESVPLSATGATDGSTFLITSRRRKPIR